MTDRLVTTTGAPPAAVRRGAAAAAAAVLCGALVAVGCYLVFVRTRDGQRLDQAALARVNGGDGLSEPIATALSDLTIGVAVVVLIGCVVLALVRGRVGDAVAAVVLVAGANITTQVAKEWLLDRPSVGFGDLNSLPSGHSTLACSLLLAVLLVAPRVSRGVVVLVASAATCVVGLSTVVAGWHRPSDVVAAFAVCLAWAGLVSAGLLLWAGVSPGARRGHLAAAGVGAFGSVVLAVVYGVRPEADWHDLIVNAGTVLGIAAAAALTVAAAARVLPTGR